MKPIRFSVSPVSPDINPKYQIWYSSWMSMGCHNGSVVSTVSSPHSIKSWIWFWGFLWGLCMFSPCGFPLGTLVQRRVSCKYNQHENCKHSFTKERKQYLCLQQVFTNTWDCLVLCSVKYLQITNQSLLMNFQLIIFPDKYSSHFF